MNNLAASHLAGHLSIIPGAPMPHGLLSSRQDWAATLSANKPVDAVPGLMASLFSLCGNAHRVGAQLAIDASNPDLQFRQTTGTGERLRLETAQEHVRRIGLDWPRLLQVGPTSEEAQAPALDSLAACPLLRAPSVVDWAAAHGWLHHKLLHMDPAAWLRAWIDGAGAWLNTWSQKSAGWLPDLLRQARLVDLHDQPLTLERALRVHQANGHLNELSAHLANEPGFALTPIWRSDRAHTGPWARLQTPGDQAALSPWAMLGSRLAELVRLCLPDTAPGQGARWLRWGSLSIRPGLGLGWVEMARGLLVHQVTMADSGTTVQHCRVIAPTEWNFHPEGEVARRLTTIDMQAPEGIQRVRLLMAAFDPCVPFDVSACGAREMSHA